MSIPNPIPAATATFWMLLSRARLRLAIGSALSLLALVSPVSVSAEPVTIELHGVQGRTGVLAFPVPGTEFILHGVLQHAENKEATYTVENPWRCQSDAPGPRLFVFGAENAATYFRTDQICAQLASGNKIIVELEPRIEIHLTVWLKDEKHRVIAQDEIANANWIFRKAMAGVLYTAKFYTPQLGADFSLKRNADQNVIERKGKTVSFPDLGCDELRGHDGTSVLEPSGINVLVGFGDNLTCPSNDPGQRKNIIFLGDLPVLGALAHELAHSGGVDSPSDGNPEIRYQNGHVPPKPVAGNVPARDPAGFFPQSNTMVRQAMILHDSLTMGQVFWMNFSRNSFLAQERLRLEPNIPNFPCPDPTVCPGYTADFPAEPVAGFQPSPSASARKGAAAARHTSCGASLNSGCPPEVINIGDKTRDFASALSLNKKDAVFNFHFALTMGLTAGLAAETPRYCTRQELIDALGQRFDAICGGRREDKNAPKCGSIDRNKFVDLWKQNVASAILIAATASAAAEANLLKNANGGSSPMPEVAYEAYAANAADKARKLVVNQPGLLRKAKGKRVLWMDAPGANRVEIGLLESLGIIVNCSDTPEDTVRDLKDAGSFFAGFRGLQPYSLVITSFRQGMGFELLQRLRDSHVRVPAVIYSKNVTEADVSSAKAAGALDETEDPLKLIQLVLGVIHNGTQAPFRPATSSRRAPVPASPTRSSQL